MNKLELVKQFTEISERIMLQAEKGERIAIKDVYSYNIIVAQLYPEEHETEEDAEK